MDLTRDYPFAFGDFVCVHRPEESGEWKFDLKNELGIYVGSLAECKGGKLIYWPFTHSTAVRGDVTKIEITDEQFLRYYAKAVVKGDKPLPYKVIADAFTEYLDVQIVPEGAEDDARIIESLAPIRVPLLDESETVPAPIRRKKSRKRAEVEESDRNLRSAYRATLPEDELNIDSFVLPRDDILARKVTVGQVLKGDDADRWKEAMLKEISQLLETGTLVPNDEEFLPDQYRVIHSTMQLKLKLLQTGEVEKRKARLCACGTELYGQVAETYRSCRRCAR